MPKPAEAQPVLVDRIAYDIQSGVYGPGPGSSKSTCRIATAPRAWKCGARSTCSRPSG